MNRFVTANAGLPEGWTLARLADATVNVANVKPEDEPQRVFGYVDISAIDNTTFQIAECKHFSGADARSRARRPIEPGDVLFSNVRTYLRNIALVPESVDAQLCSTGFTVLRTNGALDPRYLFRFTLTNEFIDAVTPQQTGTHYPATSDRVVLDQTIPLPPLAEQRRIVAKVEELLGRVNAARARLANVPAILKRFRQAILAAACSGQLTADWRSQHPKPHQAAAELVQRGNTTGAKRRAGRFWGGGQVPELTEEERESIPSSWLWVKVQDAGYDRADAVQVGPMSMQSKDFADSGIPVLNVGCIQWGEFDNTKLDFMPPEKAQAFGRYRILAGDILFTRSGTIGRCAVATHAENGYLMTFHLLRVRPNPQKVINEYLRFVFQGASHIRRQMDDAAIGSTRPGFNTGLLAGLQVPLAPLDEQREIVRRVNALFALADKIEAPVESATARVEKITQAILARAFRGELLPTEAELARQEGRDYEPASVLLDRIKAQKKPAPQAPLPSRTKPRMPKKRK